MKKLMVALAAVALAMGVNAAAVDWNFSQSGAGATMVDQQIMAFSGSDYATVVALLTETGSDDMGTELAKYRLGATQTIVNNRGNAQIAKVTANDAPDSMFWVLFTDKSTDAGSKISWTAATDVKGAQYTPPQTGTPMGLNSASFANSGTIASVPEPTSALLLVLGMAGLALKRKRA